MSNLLNRVGVLFVACVCACTQLRAVEQTSWSYRAHVGEVNRVLMLDAERKVIYVHDFGVAAEFCRKADEHYCFSSQKSISFALPKQMSLLPGSSWSKNGYEYTYSGWQQVAYRGQSTRVAVVRSQQVHSGLALQFMLTQDLGLIGIEVESADGKVTYWLDSLRDSGFPGSLSTRFLPN